MASPLDYVGGTDTEPMPEKAGRRWRCGRYNFRSDFDSANILKAETAPSAESSFRSCP